jgi:hypothetical protein
VDGVPVTNRCWVTGRAPFRRLDRRSLDELAQIRAAGARERGQLDRTAARGCLRDGHQHPHVGQAFPSIGLGIGVMSHAA